MFGIGIEQLAMNCLYVLGGGCIGYVIAIILGAAFDKWILKKKSPEFVHKSARIIVAIASAILVAMIVFGNKGTGGGGSTGAGPGDTPSTNPGSGGGNPSTTPTAPATTATKATIPSKPAKETIRIVVLGGDDVKDERFYLIDDEAAAMNFEESKRFAQARIARSAEPLGLEIRLSERNPLVLEHRAVTQLRDWARNTAKLSVTFP